MRYVCIHAHNYQPPRENPWTEKIDNQDSAYPFKNWNERITSECYKPNTEACLIGKKGDTHVNNYSFMSFNFGPTLLSWMKQNEKETYQKILQADKVAMEKFGGHGTALAQVYNHMILPLANDHDLDTQVCWGIKDFEYRFKRKPKGMWLSETAVNLRVLEKLVDYGISYTILSPYQAKGFKLIKGSNWQDCNGGRIDPRRPYRCFLPSGRYIDLFFYDAELAKKIAFCGALSNGSILMRDVSNCFTYNSHEPQLVNIATDGESYGHHHKQGEMTLAYFFDNIEKEGIKICNYDQFLEMFPPQHEVSIFENTAWSCCHGIERWKSNCGCNTGGPLHNQEWRSSLRYALDHLRDKIIEISNREGNLIFNDVWKARNDYIDIILNNNFITTFTFVGNHLKDLKTKERAFLLLEMQRQAMFMYTSCGWFFDEISGIETVQILKHASRVIQLASFFTTENLEEEFLNILKHARSNLPEYQNGEYIYLNFAKGNRDNTTIKSPGFSIAEFCFSILETNIKGNGE